ncbi:MAG: hypothetical protein Q7P63_08320 [Verrucomicrobiota bacterium JB022]|nr:hypothetical protein [Verrucomicrobiota bacterium JB022]
MKIYPLCAFAVSASAFATAGLHAAILASYDFTGIGNAQLANSYEAAVPGTGPTVVGDEVTASALISGLFDTTLPSYGLTTSGSNIAAIGALNGPVITDNLATNGMGAKEIETGGEYDAKVTNDFLEFTLTPAAGNALSFQAADALSFDAQLRYGGSGSLSISTTLTVALYTSLDDYTTPVGSATLTHNGAGGTKSGFAPLSIDLAAIGNAPADTAVSFRLYFYTDAQTLAGSTTLSNRNVDLDNFVVNGSLALPSVAAPAEVQLELEGATPRLKFASQAGATYDVQMSDRADFAAPTLAKEGISGNGGQLDILLDNITVGTSPHFFRVVARAAN